MCGVLCHLDVCTNATSTCFISFQFAQDFDIYEQHCPFEQINLRSLDDAVEKCADFRKYLEVLCTLLTVTTNTVL